MLITCFSPVSAFAKTEAQAKSNNTVKQVQEKPYEESDFFISGTTFNGLTPAGKTKLQENNGKLVFPSLKSQSGRPVSNIGADKFKELGIKEVIFSNDIESIGHSAFYKNEISKLVLPNSVKEVEYGAFAYNKITDLKLSESCTLIYPSVFGNNQIKEVTVPDCVGEIRINAFEKNPGDPAHGGKVVLTVSDVDQINFFNDTKDTYFIKTKTSNDYIASDFTYNNTSQAGKTYAEVTGLSASGKNKRTSNHSLVIPSVVYGKVVNAIGKEAFSNKSMNEALKFTDLKLPSNVVTIGDGAFIGNGIKAVEFPKTLQVIEQNSFSYNALKEVFIPESVKKIGLSAFMENLIKQGDAKIDNIKGKVVVENFAFDKQEGSKDITPVYLKTAPKFNIKTEAPEGVKVTCTPEKQAEEGQEVKIKCEISDPNKEILSLTVKKKYGTVKVTDNTFKMPKEDVTVVVLIKDKYSQDKWCIEDFEYERYEVGDIEDENYINEMTVKGFSGKGVEKLKNNKEVVLPAMNLNGEKVEAVYEKSFVNKGITKLTVPGNYKKIYDEAFKGNKIKSLVLNEGLVYIFDRTFANNEIEEFVAPKSFKYASKAAFQNNKLKKVILTDNVTSIGPESFSDNEISELDLGNKVELIYAKAFANNKLEEVNIPKTLKKGLHGILPPIAKDAFDGNPGRDNPQNPGEKKVLLWTPEKDNPNKLPAGNNYVVDPVVASNWNAEDFVFGKVKVKEEEGGVTTEVELNAVKGFSEKGLAKLATIKDIELPAKDDKGAKVEAVDNNAFAGEFGTTRFNTLKIPEGYRVIGAMAFAYNGCGGDLVLPDSLEAIGMAAFFRNAFTSLTVPAKVKELPLSMARGNKIKTVTFKGNIETLGRLSLAENEIEELHVPDSLSSIGAQALYINTGVDAYDGKVVIRTASGNNPQNLANKENYLVDPAPVPPKPPIDYTKWVTDDFVYDGNKVVKFSDQGKLKVRRNKNLVIPDKTPDGKDVEIIEYDAFRNLNMGYDIESVKLPDTITEIGDYALQFNNIQQVKLPRELKRLGLGVFMMSNVEKVEWNDKLEYIDQGCFANCPLGKVEIPASVETIMNASFRRCELTEVKFGAGSKLKTIASLAFADNKLTGIDLPEGLEKIGSQAFANRKANQGNKFKEISVPASLKELGAGVFTNNPGVEKYDGAVVVHTPEKKNPNKLRDDTLNSYVIDPEVIATEADKEALKQAVAEAEKVDADKLSSVKIGNNTGGFKAFFTETLTEAKRVLNDAKASKARVDKNVDDMNWTLKRSEIAALMFVKESLDAQSASFDKEKWQAVEDAYKAAKKYVMVLNITDKKVTKIIKDLDIALKDLKAEGDLKGATAYEGEANTGHAHNWDPYVVKVKVWVKDGKIVYVRDNGTVCDDPNEHEEHNRGYFEMANQMLIDYIGKDVADIKNKNYKETGIDVVAGATYTCDAFQQAISKALKDVHTETVVVPENPDVQKPYDGYVRLTFDKGEHGTLEGKSVIDVRKGKEVDLNENAPKVKAADGWKFIKWDKELKGKFEEDTKITAQYEEVKAGPAKPDDKKPLTPDAKKPAKPATPDTPAAQKTPLIIKSSKAINLTAEQQKGMAEGKYSVRFHNRRPRMCFCGRARPIFGRHLKRILRC